MAHRGQRLACTGLRRIAELAEQAPQLAFTTLAHHMDVELLKEAFRRTRKDAAPGVDGQTAADYEVNLEDNLRSLLERAKSGLYRAPAVRRVRIPKGDGRETRPIGIPTFEDKVLQRAVVMLLEPIYEQDFYDCSYGFRPGCSAHQALERLWHALMAVGGGWVLEVDIRRFFDTLDHGHLREFVRRRVRDGVVLRLIGKWLKAGVLEDGALSHPGAGTPQGGVISPLLANVYLHYVLDEWWHQEAEPRLCGRASLVRYADDFVIVFESEQDARRVAAVLPQRFQRFGLALHPDKTRLVRFGRPREDGPGGGGMKPGTFNFLGFTHYWRLSHKGKYVVHRRTAADRVCRALTRIHRWCRQHRHDPVREQHQRLTLMLTGHDAYYGITGNGRALVRLRFRVERIWRYWLNRRSWRARMPWPRFVLLLERYPLPRPRVVHSIYRLAANP